MSDTSRMTPKNPLRRATLAGALRVGIGVVLLASGKRGAAAELGKLDKAAVQYTDAGGVKEQDCDDCVHFFPGQSKDAPGTCRIVEGLISPHGHCVAFSRKVHT